MTADWLVGAAVLATPVALLFAFARRPGGVALEIQADQLDIRIRGGDRVLALSRRIRIPVAEIRGVAVAPRRLVPTTGLRLPGTSIPGVLRAGSYGTRPRRDFWLVRRAQEVLVIQLEQGAAYRRIVLEVPDPAAEAKRLRPTLGFLTETME